MWNVQCFSLTACGNMAFRVVTPPVPLGAFAMQRIEMLRLWWQFCSQIPRVTVYTVVKHVDGKVIRRDEASQLTLSNFTCSVYLYNSFFTSCKTAIEWNWKVRHDGCTRLGVTHSTLLFFHTPYPHPAFSIQPSQSECVKCPGELSIVVHWC